jgi:hypothetical protein
MNLGFDASTNVVGFAFVENKNIFDCGFIDISKIKGNREKAWFVIESLKSHSLLSKIDSINLEASLSGFAGPSSRAVIVMLARWNAVFEYVLEDYFKKEINLVNVATARKQAFGKAKIKGMKPKEYVKMMMDKMYDLTPWEKTNKLGNIDKRIEDVRDAVVIALYNSPKI